MANSNSNNNSNNNSNCNNNNKKGGGWEHRVSQIAKSQIHNRKIAIAIAESQITESQKRRGRPLKPEIAL
eukprot:3383117-Lingulodinium_polyedra.AAC.1